MIQLEKLAISVDFLPQQQLEAGLGAVIGIALIFLLLDLLDQGGDPQSEQRIAAQLRTGRPGVVGRVSGGRFILDMLTVGDEEVIELAAAVRAAMV